MCWRLPNEVALPLCVEVLTAYAEHGQQEHAELLIAALNRIGSSKQDRYVPLVETFLQSRATCTQPDLDVLGSYVRGPCGLRDVAIRVLRHMGAALPRGTLTEEEVAREKQNQEAAQAAEHARELFMQMDKARAENRTPDAQRLAREIVNICQTQPSAGGLEGSWLERAHETLGNWDEVINVRLRQYGQFAENAEESLVEALVNAKQYDNLAKMADSFNRATSRFLAAKTLLENGRLDTAGKMLAKLVHDDPGDWTACVLMARLEQQKQRFAEADTWMERALQLDPPRR